MSSLSVSNPPRAFGRVERGATFPEGGCSLRELLAFREKDRVVVDKFEGFFVHIGDIAPKDKRQLWVKLNDDGCLVDLLYWCPSCKSLVACFRKERIG